jgi:tetratricopeptide (TPR) repeat protein
MAFNQLKQYRIIFFAACGLLFFISSVYADNDFSGSSGKSISEEKKGTVIFGKEKNRPSPLDAFMNSNSTDYATSDIHGDSVKVYRDNGLEAQRRGDLDLALNYYQKAVELNPGYAVAYNDLGIIYEAKGDTKRAEENYLQAIKLEPDYLSPYSNLALIYENRRDFKDAAYYWKKRSELGSSSDPWTVKAKARYESIQLTNRGESSIADAREQDVINLTQNISQQKSLLRKSNKELAQDYFIKAKQDFQKGFDLQAYKTALDAAQLDPDNDSIEEFVRKLHIRLLSK